VLFETVQIKSKQSPSSGKELRELIMQAISEAFEQAIPGKEVLLAAAKLQRDEQNKAKEQAASEELKKGEELRKKIDQTVNPSLRLLVPLPLRRPRSRPHI
jgi:hypothetical protein